MSFSTNTSFPHTLYNLTLTERNVTIEDEAYDVPPGLIFLLAFLYGSISLLAVIGNGLVILVIVRNRRMHTVTNIFIANLAVADVIIGLFSIPFQFQAALLQRWVLANFMCSLAPFVQIISVNVSIITLSVIAVDRYIAVLHPFKAGCSKRSAAIIITAIWWFAILSGLPCALFYKVDKDTCQFDFPRQLKNFPFYYNLYIILVQYMMPLLVISVCYFRIGCYIWGARAPGNTNPTEDVRSRNKRKVVKMLIIVVCLFVLCWLPLQTYNLLAITYPIINEYRYINIIWFCSNWFAMSNSCYNPFIYGLLNEKFKREFRILFSMCPCQCAQKEYKKEYTDYYSEDGNQTFRRCSMMRNPAVRYNFNRDEHKRLFRRSTEMTETSQI
ncbi:tachykinin-like peptides receptor 99D [Haliotis asinina]|uniref:tachykinin-like peptides receptor 99D n=1 Tax=Haliotis asinina TaxID=109174 RepID=UPI0035325750